MQINDVETILPFLDSDSNSAADGALPAELTELQIRTQAAEIEALARWAFEDRLTSMGETVAVFDAKRRASRWANSQRRKFRKVAYTLAYVVDYQTHQIDASWTWLAAKYRQIHHESIGVSTFRRLAGEMSGPALGLIDIAANWSTYEDDEYEGRQRWNTFRVHVGVAVENGNKLRVHDWNAPLPDKVGLPGPASCEICHAAFDPERSDARYCSARCRKAASRREDVTDNEHLGEHLPEHLGEHPNHLVNSSGNTSSSSPLRDDLDDDGVVAEASGRDRAQRGTAAPVPELPGTAAQPSRASRGQAEQVIARLNEVLGEAGIKLSARMATPAVSRLLARFAADELADAAAWWLGESYDGDVYVSVSARSRAAVFISNLDELASEWESFRKDHGVASLAEYSDRVAAEEAARQRRAEMRAEMRAEHERKIRQEESRTREAEVRKRQDQLVADRASRSHWFVNLEDRTYRRALGRVRPKFREFEFTDGEDELLEKWPGLKMEDTR